MLFRQQALASENSANITPKQTEKVEASAEIAESSAYTKNCPSTSAGEIYSYVSQAKHML